MNYPGMGISLMYPPMSVEIHRTLDIRSYEHSQADISFKLQKLFIVVSGKSKCSRLIFDLFNTEDHNNIKLSSELVERIQITLPIQTTNRCLSLS